MLNYEQSTKWKLQVHQPFVRWECETQVEVQPEFGLSKSDSQEHVTNDFVAHRQQHSLTWSKCLLPILVLFSNIRTELARSEPMTRPRIGNRALEQMSLFAVCQAWEGQIIAAS